METLYLKYRSKNVSELDITEVREKLLNIYETQKVPHALLFIGPKGTGKTSAARIVAKILNCDKNEKKLAEPCNKCGHCRKIDKGVHIDVLELDAASHRGIAEARAIRDAVKLSTVEARNKVYIIDEAHMLTAEASNALLKTIEEPPSNVYFILATTNPEKIIGTIKSRVTILNFPKAKKEEIIRSLKRVIKGEKISIDETSLNWIVENSSGSFRDAVKILEDGLNKKGKFSINQIQADALENASRLAKDYVQFILKGNLKDAVRVLDTAQEKEIGADEIAIESLNLLRRSIRANMGFEINDFIELQKEEGVKLIEKLLTALEEMKISPVEYLPLEIVAVSYSSDLDFSVSDENEGIKEEKEDTPMNENENTPKVEEKKSVGAEVKQISEEVWTKILAAVKPINTSVEALLRSSKPEDFDGHTLTLGVFYQFHKDRLEEAKHRKILEDVVYKITSCPVRVICRLSTPPKKVVEETKKDNFVLTENEDTDVVKVAKKIFGA